MSQQTINVGTSPNDGTGTPLRTAFQYTNSNFSELYTALGGGSGLPGATTQVIFNDGGTNLAGDAGLVYNKTTDALTIGGNVQAASGTITGDLTVDTSTLKVDSTNNRVGIGTASPLCALHIGTTGGTNKLAINTAVVNAGDIQLKRGAFIGFSNAGDSGNSEYIYANAGALDFGIAGSTKLTLDSSGNLGLGVTPSAWGAGISGLQVGSWASLSSANAYGVGIGFNNYYNGTNHIYSFNNGASKLELGSGIFKFFTAPSGTAGNAITFTQAMTLDASGYLLLGTTDTAFTSGAGYKFGPGATPSSGQVGASTSNGDLTLRVYSTGAAAYRFYVGFGGTVYATNTTISAISDARFKENVQDIDVGLGAILALKPRKFDWKEGKGKNIKGDRGFIAQEFETVFPQLVDEWADPAPAGEAPYKSVRQDLIPVLVKAIQELAAEVNALKNA